VQKIKGSNHISSLKCRGKDPENPEQALLMGKLSNQERKPGEIRGEKHPPGKGRKVLERHARTQFRHDKKKGDSREGFEFRVGCGK